MNRRGFLGAILASAVAPAIVRADALMRIVPRETTLAVFHPNIFTFRVPEIGDAWMCNGFVGLDSWSVGALREIARLTDECNQLARRTVIVEAT